MSTAAANEVPSPECPSCGDVMIESSVSQGSYVCHKFPACRGRLYTQKAKSKPQRTNPAGIIGWRGGGATLQAKFAGTCDACKSSFEKDDDILYRMRRVYGCPSCRPPAGLAQPSAPVTGAQQVMTFDSAEDKEADLRWRDLIQGEPRVMPQDPLTLPPSVEECAAIPLSAIKLDDHQQAVVNWRRGEAIVAAAAGSGKSTVLVERNAALCREGVPPERILNLVYNRSAADGLKKRLQARLGPAFGTRIAAYTFHGWAYTMINEWFPGRFGRGKLVNVDEGPSAFTLALNATKAIGIDGWDSKDLVKLSELAREAMIDLDAPNAVELIKALPGELTLTQADEVRRFCKAYQREKAKLDCIDFADMLWIVTQIINNGGIRAQVLARRYYHVQVDEAQDINPARLRVATFLAENARSLLMVGDLRQSIYGFTGARPDLFKSRLESGAELLTLPVNRRSVSPIVDAGNFIAEGREWNLGGACQPSPENATLAAEPVQVWTTMDATEEAEAIAAEVLARTSGKEDCKACGGSGTPNTDAECEFCKGTGVRTNRDAVPLMNAHGKANYVCLVRTNAQAAGLECSFMVRNLPCRVLGSSGGMWESAAGKDVLAYLRAAAGKPTKDLAKVANKPKRYLKRYVVEQALRSGDVIAHLESLYNDKGARRLASELRGMQSLAWEAQCDRAVRFLLDDLRERGEGSTDPDDDKKAMYLALGDAAKQFGSIEAIDEQIARMKKVKAADPAVEICTMHKAKGAEWHTVFVCNAAEGVIPHQKARDIEEERRLFYVAVTRGQRVVIISIGSDKPSRFIHGMEDVARFI